MCINFETSLFSFLIGESAGLTLAMSNSIEKRLIGLFIMFYSLIQIFEANIYFKSNQELNLRLLLINLGFQGLVFFILMSYIYEINSIYIVISILVSIIILIKGLSENFKEITINNCLEWNFINENEIYYSLGLMYLIMFIFIFSNKELKNDNLENDNLVFKSGIILLITYLFSFYVIDYKNRPSIWCMSSAIVAPVILLL
jgi:hypothetical protein